MFLLLQINTSTKKRDESVHQEMKSFESDEEEKVLFILDFCTQKDDELPSHSRDKVHMKYNMSAANRSFSSQKVYFYIF